jgi:hypothetical protein
MIAKTKQKLFKKNADLFTTASMRAETYGFRAKPAIRDVVDNYIQHLVMMRMAKDGDVQYRARFSAKAKAQIEEHLTNREIKLRLQVAAQNLGVNLDDAF